MQVIDNLGTDCSSQSEVHGLYPLDAVNEMQTRSKRWQYNIQNGGPRSTCLDQLRHLASAQCYPMEDADCESDFGQ